MPRKRQTSPQGTTSDTGGPEKTPEELEPTQPPSKNEVESVSLAIATEGPSKTDRGLRGGGDEGSRGGPRRYRRRAGRLCNRVPRHQILRSTRNLQGQVLPAAGYGGGHRPLVDLAGLLARDLNDLMQGMVQGTATIYDKAMDTAYIATHEGGADHRLFDGGHTLSEAVTAGHSALADDGIIQEALGTLHGLLRDGTTPKGLPIVTWDKTTFEHVADALQSHLHIPRGWFYDLNTYDATELLGSTVGVVAMALNWNRADTEAFAKLAGSMGVSSDLAANPALLVVTVVALARAFQKARQTGDYAALVDGQVKGAIGTGSTLAAVSLVGVAGGPAGVALLAGLTAGILVNQATKKVSVVQLSEAISRQRTDGGATGEGGGRNAQGQRRDEAAVARSWQPAAAGQPGRPGPLEPWLAMTVRGVPHMSR